MARDFIGTNDEILYLTATYNSNNFNGTVDSQFQSKFYNESHHIASFIRRVRRQTAYIKHAALWRIDTRYADHPHLLFVTRGGYDVIMQTASKERTQTPRFYRAKYPEVFHGMIDKYEGC